MGAGASAGVCEKLVRSIDVDNSSPPFGERCLYVARGTRTTTTPAALTARAPISADDESVGALAHIGSLRNCIAARDPAGVKSNAIVANSRFTMGASDDIIIAVDTADTPRELQRYLQSYPIDASAHVHGATPPDTAAKTRTTPPRLVSPPSDPSGGVSAYRFCRSVEAATTAASSFETIEVASSRSRGSSVGARGRNERSTEPKMDESRVKVVGSQMVCAGRTSDGSCQYSLLLASRAWRLDYDIDQGSHVDLPTDNESDVVVTPRGSPTCAGPPSTTARLESVSALTDAALRRLTESERIHHGRDVSRTSRDHSPPPSSWTTSTAVLDLTLPRSIRRSVNRATDTDPIMLRESDTFSAAGTLAAHNKGGPPSSIILPNPSLTKARRTALSKKRFVPTITAFEYS